MLDTFVDELGALYAFVFHYMPIGRAWTLDLMMTAEQRYRLYERTWSLIRERHLFVVDFWNGATGSNGCLAAGRPGGYFHVNWNGDVSPCVFFPYSPVNVKEVYARGGSLDEVWEQPLLRGHPALAARVRLPRGARERARSCQNWIAPCLIRDHHADFRRIMAAHAARPTDEDARAGPRGPAVARGARAVRPRVPRHHRPALGAAVPQRVEGRPAGADDPALTTRAPGIGRGSGGWSSPGGEQALDLRAIADRGKAGVEQHEIGVPIRP